MSRVAKNPVVLPAGVEITLNGQEVSVKGPKGSLQRDVHALVELRQEENLVTFTPREESINAKAQAGTTRALVNNMVKGVSNGFEKKLQLVGVGYRAQLAGKKLTLQLGFSHPVEYTAPEGITFELPGQTDVLVKGVDKQRVGQVAAEIRSYRPPEPYKGKGVRYSDEVIIRKEAKKK